MQETEFRGLTIDGKWVYGHYYVKAIIFPNQSVAWEHRILSTNNNVHPPIQIEYIVHRETVGQYTGQRDCKPTKEFPDGQKIYAGDILGGTDPDGDAIDPFIVKWEHGMYPLYDSFDGFDYTSIQCAEEMGYKLERLGNIHQNPELLEAKP